MTQHPAADIAATVIDWMTGAPIASTALKAVLERRLKQAGEIALKRLAAGHRIVAHEDEFAAALFAYLRAAQEGAATANLKLLAADLVTLATERTLIAEDFRRDTYRLADLTVPEIRVLRAFLDARRAVPARDDRWDAVVASLKGTPNFAILDDIVGVCTALQRTGYVAPWPVLGGMHFVSTSALEDVGRRVEGFQDEI